MSGEAPYSQVDQELLWARPCRCPLAAPSAQEGPAALEAPAVLLALDLPVWQKTFQQLYAVMLEPETFGSYSYS